MKKLFYFFGITLLNIVLYAQTPYYYYSEGKRQCLSLNTEYAFLSLKDPDIPNDILQRNITFTDFKSDKSYKKIFDGKRGDTRFYTRLHFEEKLTEEQYWMLLSDIKQKNKDVIISPYFKTKFNNKIGLSNFFYVKLKEENDTVLLRQMAQATHTTIVEQDAFMPQWFILSLTEFSEMNAMECCNFFYESGLFRAAEPNLMFENMLLSTSKSTCPTNDTYFRSQWNLKNTGQYGGIPGIDINVCEAWQFTTSSDVTVAVIDQGIDFKHPDFGGFSFWINYDCENDTIQQSVYGSHGLQCAGIIGAIQNNSIGITGIAPGSQLLSISHSLDLDVVNIQQQLAAGINWAWQNDADVISNSWGHDELISSYIEDAINNAVTLGRNGKGCVVVFGSGNENDSIVLFPARLSSVIAVGGISPCGERKSPSSCDSSEAWAGSHFGLDLDIVAPSVFIPTTAVLNIVGNKIYFIDPDFDGTSSACPHVSAVAALILSVNPELTGQQVRDILESTAQKIRPDLYDYQTTPGRPNGTWHQEMGYGLVDAYAAVLAAQCYSNLPIVQGIIAQNTTWNSPARAKGTITIQNGATLTVTSQIECQKEVTIIVAPGGKLIIDGGTLTNACEGETWKGITIMGDYTMPMLPAYQGWLELKNGVTVENAENGILVKGGGFTVEDNVIFQNLSGGIVLGNALSESIPWAYDDDIEYQLNNITFINTPLLHHGTRLNISNCIFNQGSNVETKVSISEVVNSIFDNTSFLSDNSAFPRGGQIVPYTNVGNCQFMGNNNNPAIQLERSRRNHIYNNVISGYGTGISLTSSGGTQAQISGVVNGFICENNIYNCNIGISLYNSSAAIVANKIHNNDFGVKLYNNSYTTLNNKHIEPYQIIQDCSSIEFYTSPCSFPAIIRFNQIIDDNNLGNNFGDPLFCVDVDFCCMRVRELYCNYWGEYFVHSDDIYPPDAFRTDIIWIPGQSCSPIRSPEEILYQTGLDYFSDNDYIKAETTFKELVANFPNSHFAIAALHELFALEHFTNNDFVTLQNYLASFTQKDSVIFNTADFLATRCYVMERDWQPAIDWYEFRIENPPSYQDSVFAVIDLGNIHLMMEGDTIGGAKSGSVRYRLEEIKPKTKQHYEENKATLLATLPQIKKSKNDKFIHNNDINIPKIEKKGILGQCTPNPTTGTTTISYELYAEGAVEIFIYNSLGQLVLQIPQGTQTEGAYQATVSLINMPKGIYHYALFVDGERVDTKKIIINH